MSYDGQLGFGLLADYDALPDVELLAGELAPRSTRCPPAPPISRRAAQGRRKAAPVRRRARSDVRAGLVVALGVLVLAVAGIGAALAYFNARDDATVSALGGSRRAARRGRAAGRLDAATSCCSTATSAQTTALRELAQDIGGAPTPALAAAGQAVIVRRQTGLRVPVVALTSQRRLDATGPDDLNLRAFVEYWLGRAPGNRPAVTAPLRIALAQINATVGDIAGNEAHDRRRARRARARPARSSSPFPELALTGYPPEDLLLKEHFLARRARGARARRGATPTGSSRSSASPSAPTTSTTPPRCCADGAVQAIYRKMHLPNYGVFDEQRYFQAGRERRDDRRRRRRRSA